MQYGSNMTFSSSRHWEGRYRGGGDSGKGSYGVQAAFKARVLNEFVREHDVQSVVEFGCGDGNQLVQADYPHYVGLDVSPAAIARCTRKFTEDTTKEFVCCDPLVFDRREPRFHADLALSLDVIYHLLEDDVYTEHMFRLFRTAKRFVIIFSTDRDAKSWTEHVRHRQFTPWVPVNCPRWSLIRSVPNPRPKESDAGFFIYGRRV